jgi:uncharacterized protein
MLSANLRVLYLHGFASGPGSQKARFFAEKLQPLGFSIEVPDLTDGDFEHSTITRQLDVIGRVAAGQPLILIGSSLGGYLAALYAAGHPEVSRMILLAPAFQFQELWAGELSQSDLLAWRERGTMPVFNYGEQREMPISYDLMEDAGRYEAFPDFTQPALIFHGEQDPVVPVRLSSAYTESHSNTRLIRLPSGHELTDVLPAIWEHSREFLLAPDEYCYEKREERAPIRWN